ncbi:MAG: hypothetical protein RJA70_4945 [Pseudomonadota bacterium]|jgi:hypothetical protein
MTKIHIVRLIPPWRKMVWAPAHASTGWTIHPRWTELTAPILNASQSRQSWEEWVRPPAMMESTTHRMASTAFCPLIPIRIASLSARGSRTAIPGPSELPVAPMASMTVQTTWSTVQIQAAPVWGSPRQSKTEGGPTAALMDSTTPRTGSTVPLHPTPTPIACQVDPVLKMAIPSASELPAAPTLGMTGLIT